MATMLLEDVHVNNERTPRRGVDSTPDEVSDAPRRLADNIFDRIAEQVRELHDESAIQTHKIILDDTEDTSTSQVATTISRALDEVRTALLRLAGARRLMGEANSHVSTLEPACTDDDEAWVAKQILPDLRRLIDTICGHIDTSVEQTDDVQRCLDVLSRHGTVSDLMFSTCAPRRAAEPEENSDMNTTIIEGDVDEEETRQS